MPHRLSPARAVARRLGLRYVDQDELTWRRTRRGKRFAYLRQDGSVIRHSVTIHRLAGLAVPPPTTMCVMPPTLPHTCRQLGAMPLGAYNTAIIPSGKRCAKHAKRAD